VCAAVFFACTLSLAYTSNDRTPSRGTSVLDRPAAGAPAASGAAATGAAQVPGADSGVGVVSGTAPSPAPAASGAAAIPTK
jgi:preprotein translocase subunit SecG